MISKDLDQELATKYSEITRLVAEYNQLSRDNKHASRVGSIITPAEKSEDEDEYEDEYGDNYSTTGWVPSSLGC